MTGADALREAARALTARGRTLDAIDALARARDAAPGGDGLIEEVRALATYAGASFNAHLAAGEMEAAALYAAGLAKLAPRSGPMLAAALECHRALGRWNEVAAYARALIEIEPENLMAREALAEIDRVTGDAEGEIAHRMALAMSPDNPLHPLVRLRDTHDAASLILCRPLTPATEVQVETLRAAARAITVPADPGSEMEGWDKHYRLLLAAADLDAVRAPAPSAADHPDLRFRCAAGGREIDWGGVEAAARRLGARCVFFAAADEAYVDIYARWFVLSVLKYSDVPCLVVVHVIGGADRLAAIAEKVGIADDRLIFAGDAFDAGAVATACYDAPPKGRIEKPVAHFQSARFQQLGALLRHLNLPVFVSDIDLILQRGVADLLDRCAGDDVVFNENEISLNAGSRLTANLLLVNPTANAGLFAGFLRAYLDRVLAGSEITRWIDQLALLLARHHLMRHGDSPQVGYFDTESDINNLMYRTYQEHPFRFLSLFHGFDTSSLEGEAGVLG